MTRGRATVSDGFSSSKVLKASAARATRPQLSPLGPILSVNLVAVQRWV